MLASQRALGAVGAQRHESEQGVEIVAGKRAGVRAHPQLEFREQRVRHERHRQRDDCQQHRQGGAGRIDPDDASRGGQELARHAHEPACQRRHLANHLQAMHPFGDIRREAAVEVAIAQTRHLFEEPQSETHLEATSRGQQPGRGRPLDRGEQQGEHDHGAHCGETLFPHPQIATDVDQTAEEQCLDHDRYRRCGNGRHRNRDGEAAVGPQHLQEFRNRPWRWFREQRGGHVVTEFAGGTLGWDLGWPPTAESHQHGAGHGELLRSVGVRSRLPGRPIALGRHLPKRRLFAALVGEAFQHRGGFRAPPEATRVDERLHHAGDGVERGKRSPRRVGLGLFDQRAGCRPPDPNTNQPRRQRVLELRRRGPFTPAGRRHDHAMEIKLVEQVLRLHPPAPAARVHHLDEGAVTAPHDDEVRQPFGELDHHNGGERLRRRQQQVVGRNHDLLGRKTELIGHALHRVDRRAIDVGLTGVAETAVADRDAVALEHALERRGTAVHGRGLDDLGRKHPVAGAPGQAHGCGGEPAAVGNRVVTRRPAARSVRRAGEICSTSTSTVPGSPCCIGTAWLPSASANSTRYSAVAHLAGHARHHRGHGAVLCERKPIQPQPRDLPGSDTAKRLGRKEGGDGPERAGRNNRGHRVSGLQNAANGKGCHFRQGAGDRGNDAAPLALVLEPFDRGAAGAELGPQFRRLTFQALDFDAVRGVFLPLLGFQAQRRQAKGFGSGPPLLRL